MVKIKGLGNLPYNIGSTQAGEAEAIEKKRQELKKYLKDKLSTPETKSRLLKEFHRDEFIGEEEERLAEEITNSLKKNADRLL